MFTALRRALAAPALLLAALAAFAPASAPAQTVTIDWTQNLGQVPTQLFGINIWDGMDPAIASQTSYKNGLGQLLPVFIRYHAGEQIDPLSNRRWITSSGAWDFPRIATVMNNTRASATVRMVTISGWPAHMASPTDPGRLDPAKYDAYAAWCAELAGWMRAQGHGVTYYEPFNEVEDRFTPAQLADLLVRCRNAIRNADPNAQVGAPVYRNPWVSGIAEFIAAVGQRIDFYSYHHYASNGGSTLAQLYDFPLNEFAHRAQELRNDLNRAGLAAIPLFITEHNLYFTGTPDEGPRWMTSHRSAVFDALLLKAAAESQAIDGMHTWNDSDDTFGKLNRNTGFGLRAGGHFFRLASQLLRGEVARTTSSDPANVQAFAVYEGARHVVALINRSDSPRTITTAWAGGWGPGDWYYEVHRIAADQPGGYSSYMATWWGAPTFTLAANSVYLLRFNDRPDRPTGRQPFGGSARSLTSRIEAEHYDLGGQTVGYYDTDWGNNNGDTTLRGDLVDIYPAEGGHAVGNLHAGEYLRYTVNVPSAGAHTLRLRVSSHWGSSAPIEVRLDGTLLASVPVQMTWGDDLYTTVAVNSVQIPAASVGNGRLLELVFAGGGARVNWIEFAAAAPAAGLVPNGTYRLVNRNSGKALVVAGASLADGAAIQQADYTGANEFRWTITHLGSNVYHVTNVRSGKRLDVDGFSTADGAPIIQWAGHDGGNQRWIIEDAGGGFRRLRAQHSGKLLDIASGSTANGARAIQWSLNGSNNQQWTLSPP